MVMVVCTLDLRCEWERYSSIKANSQGYLICLIYFEVSESVLHHGCNFIASYLYRTSLANSNMMCAESIPPVIKCFATQIQRLVICLVSVLCLHVFTHGKPYGNCNSCGNPWQSTAKRIGPRRCNSPMPLRPSPASSYGRAPELTEVLTE